ncbi:MAG TPA: hypothetical protein ENG74_02900 [Thermoplasmatales archaeon]|nr:hypothetical protein [Thermoplasmatales archaeon]
MVFKIFKRTKDVKRDKKAKEILPYVRWKIKKECLEMILESSKSAYPKEFAGLLRAEGETITEVILLPGTVQGDAHAIFNFAMLPIDYTIVGTVHSHPSYSSKPSPADLHLFSKHGRIHIIVSRPYTMKSWRAYDWKGNHIEIEIIG